MTLDPEVVELLDNDPSLLAVARAVISTGAPSRRGRRLRRRALLATPVVVLAATLTPIGGASLLHRAANGLGLGSTPAAPAPYIPGDQVWTQNPPQGAVIPGANFTPVAHPPAPPAYTTGDDVWTTTPPQELTTTTITCTDLLDAASTLHALEQENSATNAVACR